MAINIVVGIINSYKILLITQKYVKMELIKLIRYIKVVPVQSRLQLNEITDFHKYW